MYKRILLTRLRFKPTTLLCAPYYTVIDKYSFYTAVCDKWSEKRTGYTLKKMTERTGKRESVWGEGLMFKARWMLYFSQNTRFINCRLQTYTFLLPGHTHLIVLMLFIMILWHYDYSCVENFVRPLLSLGTEFLFYFPLQKNSSLHL